MNANLLSRYGINSKLYVIGRETWYKLSAGYANWPSTKSEVKQSCCCCCFAQNGDRGKSSNDLLRTT